MQPEKTNQYPAIIFALLISFALIGVITAKIISSYTGDEVTIAGIFEDEAEPVSTYGQEPEKRLSQLEIATARQKAAQKLIDNPEPLPDYTDGLVALEGIWDATDVFGPAYTDDLLWRFDNFFDSFLDITSTYFGGLWTSLTSSSEEDAYAEFEAQFGNDV